MKNFKEIEVLSIYLLLTIKFTIVRAEQSYQMVQENL